MGIKRDAVVSVIALALITVVGIASYFAFLTDEERHKRLTSEVPSTLTNVYERRAVNPTSGAEGTVDITVAYKYVIDGQEYERTLRLSRLAGSAYLKGQSAKVCYNPGNHEEAELFRQVIDVVDNWHVKLNGESDTPSNNSFNRSGISLSFIENLDAARQYLPPG